LLRPGSATPIAIPVRFVAATNASSIPRPSLGDQSTVVMASSMATTPGATAL